MLAKVYSGAIYGIEASLICIEVDISKRGLPSITIVGLADKAISEAKERILSAFHNSSLEIPKHRIVINLSPANTPKEGTSFDLPIALGILAASAQIGVTEAGKYFLAGELSLEGKLIKTPGLLPLAILAQKKAFTKIIVPEDNAEEICMLSKLEVYGARCLGDIVTHLNGLNTLLPYPKKDLTMVKINPKMYYDFGHVIGQQKAKRALEIAASGFHNILLHGPPGSGKSLMAQAFPSILPPLTELEIMEVSNIYSVCGLLNNDTPLITFPPFRTPHHSISKIGLIGGGSKPKPGEISLAHRGVLFLDEISEFARQTLESLRQPLEDEKITISRAQGSATYPSRFLLLGTTNPCPCGNLNNPRKVCICTHNQIINYQKRLSGPIIDRIDLHVTVPQLDSKKLESYQETAEVSDAIRARVVEARQKQLLRFKDKGLLTNGEMTNRDVKKFCILANDARELILQAVDKLAISTRSFIKIIKVSQTIADLTSSPIILREHILEALQYRLEK